MREPIATAHTDPKKSRPVASAESLEPGTDLVSPRLGYTHHGIYVGHGKVVQYGGLVWGLRRGPVEEVSLEEFANGRPLWIRCAREPPTDACIYFYDCAGCGAVLKPRAGDCCVFCSYGSVPCPPVQAKASCCDARSR